MDTSSQLGYLQARLQARFGDRLTEADWRLLETMPDLASFLQGARATSLRRLISHLPGETDSHTAERSLRQDWRTHVDEIARWSPRAWQPAVRWCGTLSDLAPLVHLRRGERVMSWMRQDLAVAPYAQVDVEARMGALADSPLACGPSSTFSADSGRGSFEKPASSSAPGSTIGSVCCPLASTSAGGL